MTSISMRAARTIKPAFEHGIGSILIIAAMITLALVWFTPMIGMITGTLATANPIALHFFLPAGYNLALVAVMMKSLEKLQEYGLYKKEQVLSLTFAIYGMVSALLAIGILSTVPSMLVEYMVWMVCIKAMLGGLTVVDHEVSKV